MTVTQETRPDSILQAEDYKKMLLGAVSFFNREKEAINALNVFPVPDGDTGTNMSLTLAAAAETAAYEGDSIGEIATQAASKALMGARGNSGVILSQFLRGIARGLQGKKQADLSALSKAFQYGVVYAYKAVSRPVEGTILTVAREMARGMRAAAKSGADLCGVLEAALSSGRETLARTTEMLPVLKEAGVVDAGGMGLVVFMEGCIFAVRHTMAEILDHKGAPEPVSAVSGAAAAALYQNTGSIEIPFPYCTELIIKITADDPPDLRQALEPLGDSMLVVRDGDICKVHIHTATPGRVLELCQKLGSLHDLKIDNMYDQHNHTLTHSAQVEVMASQHGLSENAQPRETGVLAVSFGEGIKDLFLSLGADEIVFGGQTMNPKVEDLVGAVQRINSDRVIILPNNKNILMVAEQVKNLSAKEIVVLPTRNMAEGLAALFNFKPEASLDENSAVMSQALQQVKAGEVTHAIRDSKIDGKEIQRGAYLGLFNGQISRVGDDLTRTTLELVETMYESGDEILTVLYGQDVTADDAAALAAAIEEAYPDLEVELKDGGQPIYYYILSLE